MQGGRYYCKAENGVGVPAIKSIRVDVQYLDEPILTVHQTISDVRGSFYQEKTVFLRCTVNSNPPARFIWKRGAETLSHNQDNGVDIYEPLYTQGETKVLKVKNLRPQDYASYTCQVSVRNVCGIPDKSVTFQLTNITGAARARRSGENRVYRSKNLNQSPLSSKAETAPPSLKMSVNETLVVNPGDNVTIQCSLTGGDPTPQLTWSHSPNPMPQNSLSQGGNLTIWRIRTEDSGFYNCTASNNVGNPAKKMVNILVRSMKNATFQITPDLIKESESIQLGQDLKLSCHVDAVPQEKVMYSWSKNGRPAKVSDRLLITKNDPELPAITSSLEIIDLRFSDYGTYQCEASFQGTPIPELRVEVNISSETVPPTISIPKGQSMITVKEGSRAELQCEVRGKPKPPILWSRLDKEAPMPSGAMVMETYDGKLQLDNVTREMSGAYKCQTARYNGFNIRPREALLQLNVQFPPVVDPPRQDVRQGLGRGVLLRCTMLKGFPMKVASAIWRFNGNPLTVPVPEQQEYSELKIDSMSRDTCGTYECTISNDVGSSSCVFQVSGRAYSPEFYYDTPSPVKAQKQPKDFSYVLQWTQREPDAVDPVTSYKLDVRQVNLRSSFSKSIPVRGLQKGLLQNYVLLDLKVPQSYEVRLTPITVFGPGDSVSRIIRYSEPVNYPSPSDNTCRFEDEKICGFEQDRMDNFDWTRQNALTQNPKRSANTGPSRDLSETAEGSLNLLVRVTNTGGMDTQVWTLSGNRGNVWQQANVPINPAGSFQIIFEGVRGSGYEGDIAIDDVTVKKGDCPRKLDSTNKVGLHQHNAVRSDSADPYFTPTSILCAEHAVHVSHAVSQPENEARDSAGTTVNLCRQGLQSLGYEFTTSQPLILPPNYRSSFPY
ncbi:MAM domain-containing glycosylphosphatidylinositol anchor protein 1 isoform X1 [Rhinatrema bivittatum]|uniref:MAM domain-containing glycosylphosphatidylinositol anchor protein 1 isoform X1 n=1 Tax=Rhinatrema bivittatum TaxID=194408 RepID=UPI00112956F4|nr:MAM domain-containing glycosylphosphatidylinositol anchor protein 1 isoform X1 [Rhinatrema bivittatum]